VDTNLRMTGTTPAACRPIWDTRTFSTPSATPNSPQPASRRSGNNRKLGAIVRGGARRAIVGAEISCIVKAVKSRNPATWAQLRSPGPIRATVARILAGAAAATRTPPALRRERADALAEAMLAEELGLSPHIAMPDHAELETFCSKVGCLCSKFALSPPFQLRALAAGLAADGIPLAHCLGTIELAA
jgi:hypothetical protein